MVSICQHQSPVESVRGGGVKSRGLKQEAFRGHVGAESLVLNQQ